MTMQEVVQKFLADEYLNVQDREAFRAKLLEELKKSSDAPKAAGK